MTVRMAMTIATMGRRMKKPATALYGWPFGVAGAGPLGGDAAGACAGAIAVTLLARLRPGWFRPSGAAR